MPMFWFALACSEEPQPALVVDSACARFEGVDADWFVDPLGPSDGDGSREAPFPELSQALGPDRVVALAPGLYGPLEISGDHSGLVLTGACESGAVIAGATAVYLYKAGAVTLRDLTLRGAGHGGLLSWESSIHLEGVQVRGEGLGVLLQTESDAVLDDVVIEGMDGIGVMQQESTLHARGLVIDGALGTGFYAVDSPWLRLEDSRVVGTRPDERANFSGFGVDLYRVERASLLRTEVDENTSVGVQMDQVGSAFARDLTVASTRRPPEAEAAYGLLIHSESTFHLEHSALIQNEGPGVLAMGFGRVYVDGGLIADNDYGVDSFELGAVTLNQTTVLDNGVFGLLSRDAQIRASGITVSGSPIGAYALNGSIRLTDSSVQGHELAIVGNGGYLSAERVVAHDTFRGLELSGGSGLLNDFTVRGATDYGVVLDATIVQAQGPLRVEDTHGIGFQAQNQSTFSGPLQVVGAELAGVAVLSSQMQGSVEVSGVNQAMAHDLAVGLYAADGASLESDIQVSDVHGVGVLLSLHTLSLGDVTVQDVGPGILTAAGFGVSMQDDAVCEGDVSVSGVEGPGISVTTGSVLTGSAEVRDAEFGGLVVAGGTVQSHLVVDGVQPNAHAGGGVGVFVDDGLHGASTVELDADIQGAPLAGVFSKSAAPEVSGVVHGGEGIDWGGQVFHGDAIVAVGGEVHLVDAALVDGNRGVLLHGATATLEDVSFDGFQTSLLQQGCPAPEVEGAPSDAVICPEFDSLVLNLEFDSYLSEINLEP